VTRRNLGVGADDLGKKGDRPVIMRSKFAAVLVLAFAACSGPLAEGEGDFKRGRYPEAKQAFASLEVESRGWGDSARAEYALYRGLTLAALGDRAESSVWLREARAVEDAHSGSLRDDDARRLSVALEASVP
jgi:hypothetical protein